MSKNIFVSSWSCQNQLFITCLDFVLPNSIVLKAKPSVMAFGDGNLIVVTPIMISKRLKRGRDKINLLITGGYKGKALSRNEKGPRRLKVNQ